MAMRFLAALLLALAFSGPAYAAAPTLDGTVATAHAGSSAGTPTITVSSTSANDVVIVQVAAVKNGNSPIPSVSSVTDACGGLTWAQRSQVQTPAGSGGGWNTDIEMWWAPSTGILSSCVITVHFAAGVDNYGLVAYAVNGFTDITHPWDSNGGLPYSATGNANPGVTLSVSATTTQNNDFVIANYANAGSGSGYVPSGYTALASFSDGGGCCFITVNPGYKAITSALSSTTITTATAGPNNTGQGLVVDALTADAGGVGAGGTPAATSNHGLVLRGVGGN
jgi:hypothetical protein